MTDIQLEKIIKNARTVRLQYGVHSLFADEIPGYIGLVFNDEFLYDVIEMHTYLKNDLVGFKKTIHIEQLKNDKINFAMIIEKEPAIVLTVKNIECKNERFEMFLKKEPQERPISLLIFRNERPDTIEKMAERAEASTKAELNQPIPIDSWRGFALVISSECLTNFPLL